MTGEELRRRGFLYFEGIREGLENFEYEIAAMDHAQALLHFRKLREEYGAENRERKLSRQRPGGGILMGST